MCARARAIVSYTTPGEKKTLQCKGAFTSAQLFKSSFFMISLSINWNREKVPVSINCTNFVVGNHVVCCLKDLLIYTTKLMPKVSVVTIN